MLCVRGQGDDDCRLLEWHEMEMGEKSPALLRYIMGFGIYLKDNGNLLKDVI